MTRKLAISAALLRLATSSALALVNRTTGGIALALTHAIHVAGDVVAYGAISLLAFLSAAADNRRAVSTAGPTILSIAMATALVLGTAQVAWADFITVAETGPSSNRVDVFFLGDGYTAADLTAGTYATNVQNYVDYAFANTLNSDPYFRYRNYFNIYQVNVESAQSGADVPQLGITRNTALDATYRFDGVTDHLLYISESKANLALNSALAGSGKSAEVRFVTGGIFRGPEEVGQEWAGFFKADGPKMRWRPAIVEVVANGSLAISRGPYRLTRLSESGETTHAWGMFNSTWRLNEDGEWQVLFDAGGDHGLTPTAEQIEILNGEPDCP